ncbi:hypothetical protein PTKIN_Ptkin06aG0127800 [Pterospermum kingtungense]
MPLPISSTLGARLLRPWMLSTLSRGRVGLFTVSVVRLVLGFDWLGFVNILF